MKLTPKINRCLEWASRMHREQVRKVGDVPFIAHPFAVALILSEYTDDEDTICAALLHDVLEDVPGEWEDRLRKLFGGRVLKIVKEVSEDKNPNIKHDERATWAARKQGYLKQLGKDSVASLMVSAADKYHNLFCMIEDYKIHGQKLFDRFNAPIKDRLEFTQQVVEILKERLDSPLVGELETLLKKSRKIFSKHC